MQKTELNVSPYYDDFNTNDNFHRVLFRPSFAVQARELTTLQSILQNQIERHGRHTFKEGTVVVPGQVSTTNEYYAVKLNASYASTLANTSDYLSLYVGKIITGATSGVQARVIGFDLATSTDSGTLYVKYLTTATSTVSASGTISASTANVTTTFVDGETISADSSITYTATGASSTTTISADTGSSTLISSDATATGSSAGIESGVYFIRGNFVSVTAQRIVLDKYTNTPSYRIGLTTTESLITSTDDTSLLDNAAGTSNENSPGAHRLKITLTLAKLALGSSDDENFIELMRVKNGVVQENARNTEYSVLGDTLARRTFDESGDYTLKDFGIDIRETLDDGLNEGVYTSGVTTDNGNTSSESFTTVQVSPGKAYVRGYEIETASPTFIDIEKPRTTQFFDNAITSIEIGNFVNVTNVYGSPDISSANTLSDSTEYKEVKLFDQPTSTRGAVPAAVSGVQLAGVQIGVARSRVFEHVTGTGTTASFRQSIFDVSMFTFLTINGSINLKDAIAQGARITGVTSGAVGFVHTAITANNTQEIILTEVTGSFASGEKLFSSTIDNNTTEILVHGGGADATLLNVESPKFKSVRQIFMDDDDSGQDYTADIILEDVLVSRSSLRVEDNTTNTSSTGDSDLLLQEDGSEILLEEFSTVTSVRKESKLKDQEKNVLLRKLRKNNIKTLKPAGTDETTITLRRQFIGTANSSGVISLSGLGSGETFVSTDELVMTVLTAGTGGTSAQGDFIPTGDLNSIGGSGTGTLTLTSSATGSFGNGGVIKIIATITRTSAAARDKTVRLGRMLFVDYDANGEYGSSSHHKEISFGKADVFKVHGVFETAAGTVATDTPRLPQLEISGVSGTFTRGETITGGTSGTKAVIINTSTPLTLVITNSKSFSSSETITGDSSSATATAGTFTDSGDNNVTADYTLDTGQRDNFYDFSRLVRKPGVALNNAALLVVYDFFEHGSGDFFTVDSYSGIDYKDIPVYSATRVDPSVREPSGEFDLRNVIDFRPRVADASLTTAAIVGESGNGSVNADKVNDVHSLSFPFRAFEGSGSTTTLIPKDNSTIQYDFDFYLPRTDLLFLDEKGKFVIQTGTPNEEAKVPKTIDNAMLLAKFNFPAYTINVDEVKVSRTNNRRYTMRDIGKLETRLGNVEYYTALNLLEKDAQSLEVLDENGFNRFKSGFLVDNFAGHSTGDVRHPDYRSAIDMQKKELRPKYHMKGVTLIEQNTTNGQRSNSGYQKTGDIVTLPYSEVVAIQQPYATTVENLNPSLNFAWAGICKLSPSGDEWFEVNRLPALIINREGNFDSVFAANENAIGTIWDAWSTQWSGVTTTETERFKETSFDHFVSGQGRPIIERTVSSEGGVNTRQGIETSVVAQIEEEHIGDVVLSRAIIPFIRSKNVIFSVTGMKPRTRVYPFFDKQNISEYVFPLDVVASGTFTSVVGSTEITGSGTNFDGDFAVGDQIKLVGAGFDGADLFSIVKVITDDTNMTIADPAGAVVTGVASSIVKKDVKLSTTDNTMVTDAAGNVSGVFVIPDPTVSGNPRFRTGDRVFRLSSSSTNAIVPLPETFAQSTYSAVGVLNTVQDQTIRTRNGRVEVRQVSESVETSRNLGTREEIVGWYDPLAQSIMPQSRGGEYITKVDVYFSQKDATLPVTLQLREMQNGYPTNRVLPFGSKTLPPSSVNVSSTAATATTFTFDSLVYLKDATEYCIVLQSDSDQYLAWISRMGETDIGGTRQISTQPYLGVLFKSQNNSTWTGYDAEDLKFTVYRASFNTGTTGTFTAVNDVLPSITLNNPFSTVQSDATVTVKHPNHGMYSTSNNITISGATASGGISAGNLNNTETAIANITTDGYSFEAGATATGSAAGDTSKSGGSSVVITENVTMDGLKVLVPTLDYADTKLSAQVRTTTGTSIAGSETSFASKTNSINLGENFLFDNPQIVCSSINETNELEGAKSFFLDFTMSTSKENISPVIDVDRMSIVAFANRLNNLDTNSNEPEGDDCDAVYVTRKVALKTPATSIKVLFSAVRFNTAEIDVMHKTLGSGETKDFDEIAFEFFNTNGDPDTTVNPSSVSDDFREYEYTVNNLSEFSTFAIKIRMKGTNTSEPPRIKDLRAIALAT